MSRDTGDVLKAALIVVGAFVLFALVALVSGGCAAPLVPMVVPGSIDDPQAPTFDVDGGVE